MDNKRKLNWGIIGVGNIAVTMAEALRISPVNHLFAVASKTSSKARKFAQKYDVENILSYQEIVSSKNIDIIYIATTHNFHYSNAKLALENGKHVLVEKPFTVNAKEAQELALIAEDKNLFLMEAMWTRFLPSVKLLKKKIMNNEIGKVKQINISFGGVAGKKYKKRLEDPSLAGGVTLDLGIYAISFACYMLGELPVKIKSMARFNELGADEISNYMFMFPSGCLTSVCTSYNLKMTNEATIYGTKGYITFPDFSAGQRFTIFNHGGTNNIKDVKEFTGENHENGFIYQVEEVAQCIQEGKLESNIIPLKETIAIMEVMDKMRREWGFVYPFE